jgi:signal transduction histidine kinase/CheY-like chemotaxis protein
MSDPLARLREENAALRKTLAVLKERVERDMDQRGDAFTLFETAIALEDTVRSRTRELNALNQRLRDELQERKQVEEALRAAKQAAEDANRSKTKFLAVASHDLRQPLNAARLFLGAMSSAELPPEQAQLVGRISASLDALDDLLTALLNVSQLESGGIRPSPSDFLLSTLLERIVPEYVELGAAKGLRVRLSPCRAAVRSDYRLLETILRNFLSNAIRYTLRGGVLIGCRKRRKSVIIEVWDSGIGISDDQRETIFQEFKQAHDDTIMGRRGIGLGLYIVKLISGLLGHPVTVRSTPGAGSVFAIEVPLGEPAPADPDSGPPWPAKPVHRPLVVIIDDDPQVCAGMVALLQSRGHRTVSAPSADLALAQLIEQDRRPDLLIVDYHLAGGRKGPDAINEIQAEYEDKIAALVITSDRDTTLHNRFKALGIPLLYKPIRPARLLSLMNHLLTRGTGGRG